MLLMTSLLGCVDLGQCLAQDASGGLPFRIAPQHQPLGEGQLVTGLPRRTCRWMWKTLWNAGLPSLMAMLLPSALSSEARAAWAIRCPIRTKSATVSAGVSVRSTVCFFGMTSVCPRTIGRMSRIGQVVVVLVDADGWGFAGDDGAEDAGHPLARLAGDGRRQLGEPLRLPACSA